MTLPDPLVPAEVDLRDFGYMPLDALRLRDSELAIEASPEVFRASVLLWCAAWHQVPAGSLPAKDKTLAEYSRAGARWPRIRAEVLAKWIECSDGRLYHPVVAEKAREAQAAKDAQRARTKAATEAREAKRRATHLAPDDPPSGGRGVGRDVGRNEQRDVERNEQRDVERNEVQGKGREGKGIEEKNPPASRAPPKSKLPKPSKRCPSDFAVTAGMVAWAKANAPGVEVPRETIKFRNHEFARGRSDWHATWQNWILEAFSRLRPPGSGAVSDVGYGLESLADRAKRERIAEITGGLASRQPTNALGPSLPGLPESFDALVHGEH